MPGKAMNAYSSIPRMQLAPDSIASRAARQGDSLGSARESQNSKGKSHMATLKKHHCFPACSSHFPRSNAWRRTYPEIEVNSALAANSLLRRKHPEGAWRKGLINLIESACCCFAAKRDGASAQRFPKIAISKSGNCRKDVYPHGMCGIEILRENLDLHPEGERWRQAYRS